MQHVAKPVFELDPISARVTAIRYNQLDLGPLVPPLMHVDDMAAFYTHARVLEDTLLSLELPLRLEVGDAILIDNTRVLHGRHRFTGKRNMLGCYMNSDDWLSRLRLLERRHAAAPAAASPPVDDDEFVHWTDDLVPPRRAAVST